jgi:chromosomal replication initiator protein|tara:strand:+ start:208 stop:549 length:342 start_codon:yes stop_codon:yes gene_type:complete
MNYWTLPSQKENIRTTKEMLNYAEKIIEKVSEYYKISINDIKGKSRKRHFVKARFISMYLIRNQTSLKLKTIGDIVGRDHTTVMHSLQTIQNTLSLHYDTDLGDELKEIKRII